jgi:hypothetical protein
VIVGVVCGASEPSPWMVYCDTVPSVKFATYTKLPLTAIPFGPAPVTTVGVVIAVSAPLAPMSYCDTVLEPKFTT